MIKQITTWMFLLLGFAAMGQKQFTLSGYMRDAKTGEELLYANVLVGPEQGVVTNLYGFYSITLPEGNYEITYTYLGYVTQTVPVSLKHDAEITVELSPDSKILDEVVVTAESQDKNVTRNEMSVVTLDITDAKKIPVLFGEQDILKTIQLLPGVMGNSEGGSGFFVRGGNSDQNLILLDEAPVYSASHLLGFFSVFNSDALKDVKLYKGGMPAQYGGRASSVLDIRMKNGNSKNYSASGGIGLISSRLTLEGPIVKDKGSIIISGRRTYADLLYKAVSNKIDDNALYFYDLNMKANYTLTEKDRIYFSSYLGKDVLAAKEFGFDWGNKTNSLRWNHTFNNKLFLNTTLISSQYNYGIDANFNSQKISVDAGINDYNIKQDYDYFLNPNNSISFGWNIIDHLMKPGKVVSSTNSEVSTEVTIPKQNSFESGFYLANDQKIGTKLSINYGARLSMLNNVGDAVVKTYDDEGNVIKEISYDKGKIYNTYYGVEPRINTTYLLPKASSIKASYNRNYQYLHLLSNSTSGNPTDLWIASSPNVKPIIADQVSLGLFKNFKDNLLEFSVESYYKKLQNQVDYKDGANTLLNSDVEADLLSGKGRAYGVEFLLRKNKGNFTGWVAYTLSKVERQIDGINDSKWYSARQDRTHDISFVGTYQLGKKLSIAGTWVYSTGDAVSFPSGKYEIDGNRINLYTSRNGYRMPNYHRADLGFTWLLKDTNKRHSDLNISFYNLYNRKNAYTITFKDSETNVGQSEAVKTSLFGIVPSITWNFKY